MEKIYKLTEFSALNKTNVLSTLDESNILENSSFFYISIKTKILPWVSNFVYYFFKINYKLYIHDFEFSEFLTEHFITNNKIINLDHIDLLNNIDFKIIELDKVIFIKFLHNNAGHAFGNITNIIYYIKNNNLIDYNIVIPEDLINFSPFLTSIIYLFFDKSKIIIINDKTLVKFNKTYIIKDYSSKIDIVITYLINHLKNQLQNKYLLNYKYENICLIKSVITQNSTHHKHFNNEYNDFIKNKDYEIIIPENYDVISLFQIIYNAKNVILSWGCCSYLNSVFVNEKSNVLVLCHIGYSNEYNSLLNANYDIFNTHWFPKVANKKLILYNLKTELDEKIKEMLDLKINEMN